MSDVESHESDLDEVEKVGSQFLGCAKVRLHLLYIPVVCSLVAEERRRRKKREGVREG